MIDKSLEILIITDNSIETIGGEQESTKIIISELKDYFKIGLIQPGKLILKNSKLIYFELSKETRIKHLIKKPFKFIKYIVDVKKIINDSHPKIIHTQSQVGFFIVALLKKFRLIPNGQTLLHTERGLFTKYNVFLKKIFIFFMKELDILITTTEFNQKYWKEALNKKNINVDYKVIENTAGKTFENLDDELLDDTKEKFVIGFSGRYTNWKNWPLAVDISKKLDDILGAEIEIHMTVGCLDKKSELETQKMFDHLKKILGKRFVGKINVDMEEMNRFYYGIDVFILTSNKNTESFGRTLVEAMSRKTAVLTTDAGGSVEVVGDLNKVFNTSDEFVNEIIKLYKDENLLKQHKEENLIRVKSNYSFENNILKHKTMYEHLLKIRSS